LAKLLQLGAQTLEIYKKKLEFAFANLQSMPTEWTHVRTVRAWQSVRLDL